MMNNTLRTIDQKATEDMRRVAEEVQKIDDTAAAFLAGHVRGMMDALLMQKETT